MSNNLLGPVKVRDSGSPKAKKLKYKKVKAKSKFVLGKFQQGRCLYNFTWKGIPYMYTSKRETLLPIFRRFLW